MSMSKKTCAKCDARLSRTNKSGLCKQHWGFADPDLLLSILTKIITTGSRCPTNLTLQRALGCSEMTLRKLIEKLGEEGKAQFYYARGKRVAHIPGVGTSRVPDRLPSTSDIKVSPAVPHIQRVERHVCPRTGARITAPIALTTQGFTPWGART